NDERGLHGEDLGVGVTHEWNSAKESDDLSAQHLEPGDEECVPAHLAPEACLRDRVVRIQRDVGFVRPELLAVVRHVHDAVTISVGERGIAEEPATEEVVHGFVAHQQSVHAFVHQSEALGVRATHEQDRNCVDDDVVELHRYGDDECCLHIDAEHRERIAHRRNLAQFAAELGHWAAVGADECGVGDWAVRRWGEDHATEFGFPIHDPIVSRILARSSA
ncbi:MAG: hypothetical protein RLZ84_1527, partial [Actinomycetota bacterium]